jgi:hypothetical protein
MILVFDLSDVKRLADELGVARDQIPFAMSKTLNDAIFATRGVLTKETWPQHVTQRNPRFPSAVLHVQTSSKSNLTASIDETEVKAASLKDHAEGGVRKPTKAKDFAIPLPWYKALYQTQSGLRSGRRAQDIIGKKTTRIVAGKGIFVLYQGRMRLAFHLVPSVTMHKDVPFNEDFQKVMEYAINRELPAALEYAMKTRRGFQ